MKDLLLAMAKGLVDYPNEVEIKEVEGERTKILELKVAETDRGKVIGKEGRIIKAIRIIINAASAKQNKRVTVEIIE